MTITSEQVRALRDSSGAPMMDCKRALAESGGDLDKAGEWLRKQGIATAAKKAGREAKDGLVAAYVHHNMKLGVLLEVSCETDFVAKTDRFKDFCKDIALHVASMNPRWVGREDVPAVLVEKEREIARQAVDPRKPKEIQDKIVEGQVSKFLADSCLLEQPFVKDDKKTVEQLRAETVGVLGENIRVRRFVRFDVSEA